MTVFGAQVNGQGRVVIPATIRSQMGIVGPVDVLFRYEDGVLTVETIEDAVACVQRIVASYSDTDRSLVGEFIAQRRAEAASE
jgi:bifunctional DNA-binding transcriptional regulator/antitoxin component of YhaV-PrlF toxin-antitoxin module